MFAKLSILGFLWLEEKLDTAQLRNFLLIRWFLIKKIHVKVLRGCKEFRGRNKFIKQHTQKIWKLQGWESLNRSRVVHWLFFKFPFPNNFTAEFGNACLNPSYWFSRSKETVRKIYFLISRKICHPSVACLAKRRQARQLFGISCPRPVAIHQRRRESECSPLLFEWSISEFPPPPLPPSGIGV